MCCGKSIRGPQGPAGVSADQTQVIITTTSITAQTDLTILAASQTANLVYYGQIQVISSDSAASFIITVTPVIAGVADATKALVGQVVTPLVNLVIPISDFQPVTNGDSFELRITLDGYAFPPDVTLRLNYYYQA